MSKVFIFGGSGRVATQLIKDLLANGNSVTAGSRNPDNIYRANNVTPVKVDLHDSVDKLAELIKGHDAVYFVAGSRGKDLLQTDAFGAVKTMKAAELSDIKRYIMLSSMYALQPEKWHEYPVLASITDYNIAKYFADLYLTKNTNLDYTILQPATLNEKTGSGKVTFGPGDDTENSIADVAQVLADIIDHPNTIGHVIMMRSGSTPITQALDEVK